MFQEVKNVPECSSPCQLFQLFHVPEIIFHFSAHPEKKQPMKRNLFFVIAVCSLFFLVSIVFIDRANPYIMGMMGGISLYFGITYPIGKRYSRRMSQRFEKMEHDIIEEIRRIADKPED